MTEEASRFHWAEGMKFALEGFKILFLLNGAAAVSILTFIGNAKPHDHRLAWSIVVFALGSLLTAFGMAWAYITQLHYGNSGQVPTAPMNAIAWRFHKYTYAAALGSAACFAGGLTIAATGLLAEMY